MISEDAAMVSALSDQINVSAPVAKALCNRGVTTYDEAKQFFRATLDELASPFLFCHMERAVHRIAQALEHDETIMLYGDYDVDGTTGTAMLYRYLQQLGATRLFWYVNDRFTEGYGLSEQGIDSAFKRGVKLLITIDCGIKENEAVAKCAAAGIDVVVCDHHEADLLPPAFAIINPKVPGSTYPYRELCGCAVTFRLVQALAMHVGLPDESWQPYLDFVAIATAADMVALDGENRILLKAGLEQIRQSPHPAIRAMASVMKVSHTDIGMFQIAFGIAPRINAAGRMHSAHAAMDWLLAAEETEGFRHAAFLDTLNQQRRKQDGEIMVRAEKMLSGHFSMYCSSIVLYDESWHLGVLGIVAAKLVDKHCLPAVILGGANGYVKGSVRSVDGLDIHDVLMQCSALLEQFGGHAQAAGVTLLPENLTAFRKRFDELCRERLDITQRQRVLDIDTELGLDRISTRFLHLLEQFEPYGYGNREPLFLTSGLVLHGKPRLYRDRHLNFTLFDQAGRAFDVIAFDRRDLYDDLCQHRSPKFRMVYSIEKNSWKKHVVCQLRLRDLELQP